MWPHSSHVKCQIALVPSTNQQIDLETFGHLGLQILEHRCSASRQTLACPSYTDAPNFRLRVQAQLLRAHVTDMK